MRWSDMRKKEGKDGRKKVKKEKEGEKTRGERRKGKPREKGRIVSM